MPTFVYREFHFTCDICGANTIGLDVAGSNFRGWGTRKKARAGLIAHLKECRKQAADARADEGEA